MLNVGIVGLGGWGRRLVEAAKGSNHLRFAAAVVANPAKHEKFAAEHGFTVCKDLKTMLTDPKIEAVVSTGPAGLHAAHSLAAIDAGKPVLAVKPMAIKGDDAIKLREAAKKRGVLLALGYNRCFYPAIDELRRRIKTGDLGTLLHAEGNFCVDRYFKLKPGDWKYEPDQVLAGALTDHPLYAMIELLGPVVEVDAHGSTRGVDVPITDTTAILLRFKSGASGLLTAMGATATYERLTFFGAKGWAEVRGGNRFEFQPVSGEVSRIEFPPFDAERAELEAFADAVAGKRTFPVPVDEAVHSVVVLEAMNRSARQGSPVNIS